MPETIELSRLQRALNPKDFRTRRAGQLLVEWQADIEPGTPKEQLLTGGYWANVAGLVKGADRSGQNGVGGEIVAVWKDNSRRIRLLIEGVAPVSMTVLMVEDLDLEALRRQQRKAADNLPKAAADFTVEWKGPVNKWSVLRSADNQYMHKGAASEADAREWLNGYLKPKAA